MKNALARIKRLKPYRVYEAYSLAGGNLSAAGMSFQSFFAVFAAVWVSFSVSGLYLNAHPDVKNTVITFINMQIPNLIAKGGAIEPDLLSSTTFSWTGALALIILGFTAVNWIEYTRVAMHHMFGLPKPALNFVLLKLWDLLLAVIYGVLVLVGASVTVLTTSLFDDVISWLGLDPTVRSGLESLVRLTVVLLVFVVDVVMLAVMIRIFSGVPIPMRYLWRGAALGGIALGIMKLAGGALLSGVHSNPLFATFAVFIALLIWFNLMCRVYLLTAQWISTSMRDNGIEPRDGGWIVTRESIVHRIVHRN